MAKTGQYIEDEMYDFIGRDISVLDKRLNYLDRKYDTLVAIQKQLEEIRYDIYRDLKDAIEKSKDHGTYEELYAHSHLNWPYGYY